MSNIAKYKRSIRKLTLISNEVTYVFLRGYMRPKCVLTIFCVKKKIDLVKYTVYSVKLYTFTQYSLFIWECPFKKSLILHSN